MIPIKSEEELAIMAEGGRRLVWVFEKVFREIKPGVRLSFLEDLANQLIASQGGQPSFKMVKGYHWATCICVNQGVVHGIPGEYQIKKADLVSLDMGMYYGGFHTDMARTLRVRMQNGKCKMQNDKFLEAGKRALKKAIEVAKPGNRLGHISRAIEQEIRKAGFRPVEALTGHGIGKELHEEPLIPGLVKDEIEKTPILKPGMTLAIEVIYAQGQPDLVIKEDGWTIETEDQKLAGLFEDTIVITKTGPQVLTNSN